MIMNWIQEKISDKESILHRKNHDLLKKNTKPFPTFFSAS